MKKRTNFDRKFPLFVKYIQDPDMQANMADNADLIRKYNAYSETIGVYLSELDKRFDVYTIKNIIVESIIKLPDSIMTSLITSYLNSSEEAKSNADFITYYNKASNMGMDSLGYVEQYGIVANRSFKDIPEKAIDAKYESVRSGAEQFNGKGLDEIYYNLPYPARKFVISLIEAKILEDFDIIFEKFSFTFETLITVLMARGIDADILNKKSKDNLGQDYVMILVCLLLDNDETFGAIGNIKKLLANEKYDLLKDIINENLLVALSKVNYEEIETLENEEVLELLKKRELVLTKQEN